MKPKRFAVFISGRGSNLEALLKLWKQNRLCAEPVLVISHRREAPGLDIARQYGVAAEYLSWKRRPQAEEVSWRLCRERGVDFLVLAGFLRILRYRLLEAYPWKILNIHPSLLPAFPGMNAVRQALDYGVRVSGCTTHFVTAEVDRGPIILQKAVEVEEEDTEETLAARIRQWEHRLLPTTVNLFAQGALHVMGQKVHIEWEKLPHWGNLLSKTETPRGLGEFR